MRIMGEAVEKTLQRLGRPANCRGMARPLRLEYPRAFYHVMPRAKQSSAAKLWRPLRRKMLAIGEGKR